MINHAATDPKCILCYFRAIEVLLPASCVFLVFLQGICWLSVVLCWVPCFFGEGVFLQLKLVSENTRNTFRKQRVHGVHNLSRRKHAPIALQHGSGARGSLNHQQHCSFFFQSSTYPNVNECDSIARRVLHAASDI